VSKKPNNIVRRVTIQYGQDIRNDVGRYIGRATMECEIEVEINLDGIELGMGARACRSKSGRCKSGNVLVKRKGRPREVSREIVHGWGD
jgi:hypothetical protein